MKILITGGNGNIAKIIKNKLSYLYDITNLGRTELNILSYEDVKSYLETNEFDILIHTAIIGGRRTKDDPEDTVEKNVEMFDNLMKFSDKFKMIINFDSAAIYDRSTDILNRFENQLKSIPEDKYGKSKYLIYKKSLEYKNVYNLRLFNIFHANEEKDRFIKACFIARNENTILTINEDKYFDFFYELDFIKVIKYYIQNYPNLEKTVNLCYEKKYKLSEIAKLIINNHDNIKIINQTSVNNYTGNNNLLKKYNIEFLGLEESLKIYDKRYIDLKDRRIKIIIWAYPLDWKWGGIVVLHHLCQNINDINHPNFYSKLYLADGKPSETFRNTYYTDKNEIIDDNTIVIYATYINGNPLNCNHVVRWHLQYTPEFITEFKDTDLIYNWQNYTNNKTEKILSNPYFTKIFKNNNKKERTKTCYIIKKGYQYHGNITSIHPIDSIFIYYDSSHQEICNIFNECKYFYCYDPNSMFAIYAVICGCITILYPTKNKTKEEYFKVNFYNRNNKIYNYGIAYGNSEEEIKFATDTLAEGEFMYKELFESCKDTVYDFLKDLEIYFKEKNYKNIKNTIQDINNIGISLGWNCHSANYGVKEGIRNKKENGYLTCPFDMMVSNYQGIVDCFNDDFKYFCDDNFLELKEFHGENMIYHKRYNFLFNHESPGHANFYITQNWDEGINHFVNNNYYNLKKRYLRRIRNLKSYLESPNNYITFILTSWNKKEDDIEDLKSAIKKHYPKLSYKIIIINDPYGKEYYLKHMIDMNYTDEINRLLTNE